MSNSAFYAVLMGDLVESERHAEPGRLHAQFNAAIDRQNAVGGAGLVSPLTITLGDEFQGLFGSLVGAAQAARAIRFELMREAIDCRFVIGMVELKTDINRERAWNMMGPGFARARERLGEKRSPARYRFSIPQDSVLETMLEANGAMLTAIEQDWSQAQQDDILNLLQGASVAEVARARNVSAHSIYKVRSAGRFDLYLIVWNAMTEALAALDGRFELPGGTSCGMPSSTPA